MEVRVIEKLNNSVTRAILHALPTAILALDSTDTIVVANAAASKLLGTPRDHLEGGSLSRFVTPGTEISSVARAITFTTSRAQLTLAAAAKDLVVDDTVIRVILLRPATAGHDETLTKLVSGLALSPSDPFAYVCRSLVDLGITQNACVRSTTSQQCDILASTTTAHEVFSQSPTIARSISRDEVTHVELVIIPDSIRGLTREDLSIVDMFISLLNLRVDNSESASDASGSETALSLALKAGDMGMCFFDTSRGDCYLSDRLATWCGINMETFTGTIDAWLDTFRDDDRARIATLFGELEKHKKFKTVVNIHTLEDDMRVELVGRPLHENSTHEWVAIVRPFRDEQEVEAAWHTRIAMEESARMEAEELLEGFEKTLTETLLPTTSDVSIVHARQDAGTWHIVRPIDAHSSIYAVGAVTAGQRSQAVVGATLVATIADVLASTSPDVETFVSLVRDHARARDIETSIAAVHVVGANVYSATHGGASVYISGKSFVGTTTISATTALSLSSHSEASPETIDVAANGRPWRIMSTVIEVLSRIETDVDETASFESHMKSEYITSDPYEEYETVLDINEEDYYVEHEQEETDDEDETDDDEDESYDVSLLTGRDSRRPNNVSPFRSGSISPN